MLAGRMTTRQYETRIGGQYYKRIRCGWVTVLGIRVTCANRWSESSGVLAGNLARTASAKRSPGRPHALNLPPALQDRIHHNFWANSSREAHRRVPRTQYFTLKHPTTFRSKCDRGALRSSSSGSDLTCAVRRAHLPGCFCLLQEEYCKMSRTN
jgi:hypothetical protein